MRVMLNNGEREAKTDEVYLRSEFLGAYCIT